MPNLELIDVPGLETADNVCNQVLREVITVENLFSLAHVTMEQGNVSLLHDHSEMSEIYFMLSGDGIIYHGNRALRAVKPAPLYILPGTEHRLYNTGEGRFGNIVHFLTLLHR